jgi:glutathione synthase
MPRAALIIHATATIEDGNFPRFARALTQQGYETDILLIDTLGLIDGTVTATGFHWHQSLKTGEIFPDSKQLTVDHDLIWILGLGDRRNFLDKYQLLYAVPDSVQLVNSLEAIMHVKSKYLIATLPETFSTPETHASTNAQVLIDVAKQKGGKWIIKPPAGSLGRDVYLHNSDDDNLISTIKQLCGPDNANYTMLQRYVPEVENGEKRVLIAGGHVIGQYKRIAHNDHRTNLSQGAEAESCELTNDERDYCEKLGQELVKRGAFYAGIDLAYPWLIEINVISPGGITTIETLTGIDHSAMVVDHITNTLNRSVTSS